MCTLDDSTRPRDHIFVETIKKTKKYLQQASNRAPSSSVWGAFCCKLVQQHIIRVPLKSLHLPQLHLFKSATEFTVLLKQQHILHSYSLSVYLLAVASHDCFAAAATICVADLDHQEICQHCTYPYMIALGYTNKSIFKGQIRWAVLDQ